MLDRTGHSLRKSKRAENENKNYKSKLVSGILKVCANFEAFGWNISSSTNPKIVRSDRVFVP